MYDNKHDNNIKLCDWCGQPANIIWVHGHGQCSVCGYNVDECCRGENCSQIEKTNLDNSSTKPE